MVPRIKQWNWRSVLYCVAILSGFLAGPLFGDTGRLAAIAACCAFLMWHAWKRTKFQLSFRETMAVLFPPRDRRVLLRLLPLLALLGLLALGLMMPAVYYYGVTGFPWHYIASGVVVVAGLVLGWRGRRYARVSAGSQQDSEASPLNGEAGRRRAQNPER